jgi:hypothetical protein
VSRNRNDYVRGIYDEFRNNPGRNRKSVEVRMYERLISEMAMARFDWQGMPKSIDIRFLELTLFYQALSVFYFDRDFDCYFALRGSGTGPINMYDNPTIFKVVGNTYVNKTLRAVPKGDKPADCVPIWGNFLRIPDWDIVQIYATKLAEIDRTIEQDILAMRHPYLVAANDNQKLSLQNVFRQVAEGQPAIFGVGEAFTDQIENMIKVFNLQIDKEEVINLQLVKSKVWNECMTLLGINNANQDKRERLVTSEVSANNSQVLLARQVALDARRDACKRINERWENLNVSVHWNVDEDNLTKEKQMSDSNTGTEQVKEEQDA